AGNQQQLMQRIQLDASQLGLTDVHILQGDAPMNIFANGGVPLNGNTKRKKLSYKKIASYALGVFALMLIGHIIFSFWPFDAIKQQLVTLYDSLGSSFLIMLAAGFAAQLVDGALGMGYGVTSATILLSAGVNPAAISGSIHTAEM